MMRKFIRKNTVTLLAAVASVITPLHAENQKPGEDSTIRVLTYNACRGGTYQGQPLSQSAKMIAPDHPDHHHMRIDYVYFRGEGVQVTDAKIIGEKKENADIVISPYPSDHRAVVATFTPPYQLN